MKIIKHNAMAGYLAIAILYFFFNSLLLPEGLLYTAILTPFFLWWLYRQNKLNGLWYFFLFTIPFIPLHFYEGTSAVYYIRSYILFFTSYTFGMSVYFSLKKISNINIIFRPVLLINFLLIPVALLLLEFSHLKAIMWFLKEISPVIGGVPRLKMFTYEASYYSLLLAPIAIYYYLKALLSKNKNYGIILIMITLPLLLSFSLGVIAGIALTFICLFFCSPKIFLTNQIFIKYFLITAFCGIIILLGLLIFYPDNPLYGRINNIFTGQDTSFRGRTYESFILAWKIASQKSVWFGCGLGQVKIVGVKVFHNYYGYLPPVVRIPNTLGDTLATYGIVGVFIRMGLTFYFFFKTKVTANYYRLCLFIFIARKSVV